MPVPERSCCLFMVNRNLTAGAESRWGLAASMGFGQRKRISLSGRTVFVTERFARTWFTAGA